MTYKWIVPGLVAAVAGLLAFHLTRHGVCRPSTATPDLLQDVSFLKRELKLNDAQTRELQTLHAFLGKVLSDGCARSCAARARLGQALAGETQDPGLADTLVEEMCRIHRDGEKATLDHIRRVRTLLDAEQKRRFEALIMNCLCSTCANPRCQSKDQNREQSK